MNPEDKDRFYRKKYFQKKYEQAKEKDHNPFVDVGKKVTFDDPKQSDNVDRHWIE